MKSQIEHCDDQKVMIFDQIPISIESNSKADFKA